MVSTETTQQTLKRWHSAHAPDHVTAKIAEGCLDRLAVKGTLTPKQTLWVLKSCEQSATPIPHDIGSIAERAATAEDQRTALARITEILDGLVDLKAQQQPAQQLFDWGVQLHSAAETAQALADKLKSLADNKKE